MSFDAVDEYLDPGFRITIGGREFRVEAASADTVLRLQRKLADQPRWSRRQELDEIRRLLGSAWDDLVAARIAAEKVLRVGRAVTAKYTLDESAAVEYWTTGTVAPKSAATEPTAPKDDSAPGRYGPFDPGGGTYREEFGDREWYNPPHMAPAFRKQAQARKRRITWPDLLELWTELELDFQSEGIDLGSDILTRRPWRWFEVRVARFVRTPTSQLRQAIDERKDHDGNDPH
ncbi:hypothetical protein HYG77_04750 [Rhodococcus sp. ZPP]|uniref:DUF7426 family protein n=1 Tax=Rhodococcus sp. ZPP TaxID=2749906 RepID=UPI001AD86D96|nr:hypothetical protein [Rhodococcus sp. ZPP]QTJ64974.1 hypothetical protein HYG77_04750 [Rhodococcus sp. ZPP]